MTAFIRRESSVPVSYQSSTAETPWASTQLAVITKLSRHHVSDFAELQHDGCAHVQASFVTSGSGR